MESVARSWNQSAKQLHRDLSQERHLSFDSLSSPYVVAYRNLSWQVVTHLGHRLLSNNSLQVFMDRGATQFSQSGLPSPYSSSFGDHHSEGSSADHASAAQYPGKQDYPTSVTPTSEYSVYPPTARSGSYSEHIQRSYHPSSSASSGGMAQQQNSPSMPQHNGPSHQSHPVNSDNDVPIDPSIAAPSPTYPYGQHSPYAPNPDMSHGYSHPSGGMYAQPRPDWAGYSQHGAPPLTPGHPVYAQSPASAPQQRPSQVRICGDYGIQ